MTAIVVAAGQALYLFCPLLVASALSGVVLKLDLFPVLKAPIDAGRIFRGRRLFGSSKTWRGFAVAIVGSVATVTFQKHVLKGNPGWLALLDYASCNELALGTVMGGGAMLGELPNSFAKRRLGVAPGATAHGPLAVLFYVWDQVDLLVTAWPSLLPWVHPRPLVVLMSFVLALALHPLVSLIGYMIGARRSIR